MRRKWTRAWRCRDTQSAPADTVKEGGNDMGIFQFLLEEGFRYDPDPRCFHSGTLNDKMIAEIPLVDILSHLMISKDGSIQGKWDCLLQ